MKFCRYAGPPGPSLQVSFVQNFSAAFQHRQGVLEVPGSPHFELLNDEVFRRHEPVVATIHASFPSPLEDLLIVCVTGTQQIHRGSVKLETELNASEQGIPLQPCFVKLEPRIDHAVTHAA